MGEIVETDIPARLDRLPWSRWHWFVVIALGVTWILDGLEVTLAGAISGVLQKPEALKLTDAEVGMSATFYLAGNVFGALLFGFLTDRFGRKRLFSLTLLVYLIGTALSACSWNFITYALFRLITGSGIGGEYAAINSAIDELFPARIRGRIDITINSTYWIGAGVGAAGTYTLLNPALIPVAFPFAFGNVLGPLILGPLFDKVGRKPMIVLTYAAAGLFLAITGWMFQAELLTATTQTVCWIAIFF